MAVDPLTRRKPDAAPREAVIGLRVTKAMLADIDARAQAAGFSRSDMIRSLLRRGIEAAK